MKKVHLDIGDGKLSCQIRPQGKNANHKFETTTDPGGVTCNNCKHTNEFKKLTEAK